MFGYFVAIAAVDVGAARYEPVRTVAGSPSQPLTELLLVMHVVTSWYISWRYSLRSRGALQRLGFSTWPGPRGLRQCIPKRLHEVSDFIRFANEALDLP